jgi:hypothetical protein
MTQIDVSRQELQEWYDDGVAKGAVAMTIVTDTFSHEPEQHPEYEIPGEIRKPREAMLMAGMRFSLTRPLDEQLPRKRQPNFMGCYCERVCGCG